MKHFFITFLTLSVLSNAALAERSFFKNDALIESKEDAKKIAMGVENFLIKIQKSIDFYVGGTYNEYKEQGHPIIAVKYKNYTLEYAHPQWPLFVSPNDRYWKFKMKKFLGKERLYLEVQQKKDQYTVKGFVQLF